MNIPAENDRQVERSIAVLVFVSNLHLANNHYHVVI